MNLLDWSLYLFMAAVALYLAADVVSFASAAPFVPSAPEVRLSMLDLAGIGPGMKVLDLGSGDGSLLLLAAERGAHAVGIELNPILFAVSWWRVRRSPFRDRIRVRWGSFWRGGYEDADVALAFLIQRPMARLGELLKRELKPGALFVSHRFTVHGWTELKKDADLRVYLYRI